jgi:hypothetical protein
MNKVGREHKQMEIMVYRRRRREGDGTEIPPPMHSTE